MYNKLVVRSENRNYFQELWQFAVLVGIRSQNLNSSLSSSPIVVLIENYVRDIENDKQMCSG